MLRQLGGVFGIAICAAVFAARGGYASPAQFTRGFGPALGACAGLALLGAVAGLILPSKQGARPGRANSARPATTRNKTTRNKEITMYQRLIRYRTKPDQADANIKLVEAVYAELHRTQPDGVSYATFRLAIRSCRGRRT